jgi:hypothetical protein
MAYKKQKFISQSSRDWEAQNQGTNQVLVRRMYFLAHRRSLLAGPHGRRDE